MSHTPAVAQCVVEKSAKKLLGALEVEDVLQVLDQLTQEQAWMVVALAQTSGAQL
jgi:hypothetical protein